MIYSIYSRESKRLLDSLDQAINATSLLLIFEMPDKAPSVEIIVLDFLKSGSFQAKLRFQDRLRGWRNYEEMDKHGYYTPRSGKIWNGNTPTIYSQDNQEKLKNKLRSILTGGIFIEYIPSYCHPLSIQKSSEILKDWFDLIDDLMPSWQFVELKPDFLYNEFDEQKEVLKYFSGTNKDFAFCHYDEKYLVVLLMNGGS